MLVFDNRSAPGLVLAALCLAARAACAQGAEATYSSWPLGFQSSLTVGPGPNGYGSFAGFDGTDPAGRFSWTRYHFPNGWFVGGGSGTAFGLSGLNQASAFGT